MENNTGIDVLDKMLGLNRCQEPPTRPFVSEMSEVDQPVAIPPEKTTENDFLLLDKILRYRPFAIPEIEPEEILAPSLKTLWRIACFGFRLVFWSSFLIFLLFLILSRMLG